MATTKDPIEADDISKKMSAILGLKPEKTPQKSIVNKKSIAVEHKPGQIRAISIGGRVGTLRTVTGVEPSGSRYRVEVITEDLTSPVTIFDPLIRKGFPVSSLNRLKTVLNFTDNELADTLGLSPKTLQRKKKTHGRLSRIESDIIFRNARIFVIATEVFEDEHRASEWMRKPQFGLGGRIPLDMIQTEVGAREVENLLGRMEHGVYS